MDKLINSIFKNLSLALLCWQEEDPDSFKVTKEAWQNAKRGTQKLGGLQAPGSISTAQLRALRASNLPNPQQKGMWDGEFRSTHVVYWKRVWDMAELLDGLAARFFVCAWTCSKPGWQLENPLNKHMMLFFCCFQKHAILMDTSQLQKERYCLPAVHIYIYMYIINIYICTYGVFSTYLY